MKRYNLISIGIVLTLLFISFLHLSPVSADGIQFGLAQYSHNDQITFSDAFSQTPVILTSAQRGGVAYTACAVNNAPTGFRLSVIDPQGRAGSNVWVQWLAIVPPAGMEIQAGVSQYSHNDQITFSHAFSQTPVILTSAQRGGVAYAACAVNNTPTGFRLSVIDPQGQAGSNVWVQWLAIVPPAGTGIQAGVSQYSHNDQITFPHVFDQTLVILTSAQKGGVAYAACAVNNWSAGFRLSVIDPQGQAGSNVWVQWLAIGYITVTVPRNID